MSHIMTIVSKIIRICEKLKFEKFTGKLEIIFNQGGIQGIKKFKHEEIK